MALESESQGQVQDFLEILGRRRWQVALPASFVFVLGCAVAAILPRLYEVRTRIEIKPVVLEENQLSRNNQDNATALAVAAATHQVKHFRRIQNLIEAEGWTDYAELSEPAKVDYIHRVQDNLAVNVAEKATKGGSDFVDIGFLDVDGVRAARFVNELARIWVTEVIERDRQVLETEKQVYQNRYIKAQNEKEARSHELASLTAQHQIDPQDLYGQGNIIRANDPVEARIFSIEEEIRGLEVQIAESEAQRLALQADFDEEDPWIPVPLIEQGISFAAERAQIEMRIDQLLLQQEKYKAGATAWQALQDEIEAEYARLDQVDAFEYDEEVGNEFTRNLKRDQIRVQLDTVEALLSARSGRMDELQEQLEDTRAAFHERVEAIRLAADLSDEISNLNEQYLLAHTAFLDRSTKLDVLNLAHGAPYEVVERAIAPDSPSKPNPLLIVVFALLAGLALGLGSALLAEYSKSCYRGVADVTRAMAVPVLGVVGTIVTQSERRRRRFQRFVVGFSTVLILGSIIWFTYAYAFHDEWLGTDVKNQIDALRMKLR